MKSAHHHHHLRVRSERSEDRASKAESTRFVRTECSLGIVLFL